MGALVVCVFVWGRERELLAWDYVVGEGMLDVEELTWCGVVFSCRGGDLSRGG